MLFNSYEYIFFFLPVCLIVYFMLNKFASGTRAKLWLVLCSLFFYSWWNIAYLPLILASIGVNYAVGTVLVKAPARLRLSPKAILTTGIAFNLLLLGYFKYTDFLMANINLAFSGHLPLLHIILPLGISFFTLTQIAYLVDAYRSDAKEYDLVNYALFVTFFPYLLAGPILHHKEMMPQFESGENTTINYKNLALGVFLFFIGLFKKAVIADTLAKAAIYGFDTAPTLSLIEAWITSLSYTLQLYFDFSGYTDMAIGAALMFNIQLPINFNSPYKALSIQDFWRRWHITLSRFLREYIYIPLGGNRMGELNIYRNLMITFLLGGLWHGAGWTFVFWGFLHGSALVIQRLWQKLNLQINSWLAWFITFNFVNIAWIFFRAKTWSAAIKVLTGMFGLSGIILPASLSNRLGFLSEYGVNFASLAVRFQDINQATVLLVLFFLVAVFMNNSMEMKDRFQPDWKTALFISLLATYAILNMNMIKG
ncbi:MAG: membrane-bound O-acyltransferase family protein [Firmicutes bacterium HGW-Firmicutes-15]|nr:MAG: membrane-bound O-acyltransferase family protein [Firmicutes bacterium HGW-Firmicutes-15]